MSGGVTTAARMGPVTADAAAAAGVDTRYSVAPTRLPSSLSYMCYLPLTHARLDDGIDSSLVRILLLLLPHLLVRHHPHRDRPVDPSSMDTERNHQHHTNVWMDQNEGLNSHPRLSDHQWRKEAQHQRSHHRQ